MRISYNWLKDYVDINLSPEKLAGLLTMSGLTVDSVEKRGNDSILEIEITSNRPDWLSYIGVAREVAAITGRKLKVPSFVSRSSYIEKQKKKNNKRTTVKVEEKALCPRYTARIIRNIKVGESPGWLKKRIEAVGLRPVNNIVDITNFCLFETGEPMHAFDLDKLSGNTIVVRKAAKGEKVTAIDGTVRVLDESMLVIADSEKVAAVAGVMGALNTEVGVSTRNILLEAAYFDPISVRRTSRSLALPTESSYRFERKVDIENIARASDRAAELILKTAGGEAGEFIDIGKVKKDKKTVSLRPGRLNKIVGAEIAPSKTKNILTSLGLKLKSSSGGILKFEIPPFRYDLESEIDLIEEVARIYGYDNISETVPQIVEKGARLPFDMISGEMMRQALVSMGLSEIITYGLLSRKLLSSAKIGEAGVVEIKNPLSAEQEIMRPSLMPGMLNAVRYNLNRKIKDLKLFELGKVYFKESANTFGEKRNLSIGVTGQVHEGWIGHSRDMGLFDLKGIIEALFSRLGISGFSIREARNDIYFPGACASVEIKGEPAGVIGEIDPGVLKNFDIKDKIYAAQLDCEVLLRAASLEKHFKEPPRYPSILRDISIVINNDTTNDLIVSTIKETAGGLLKDVRLIDKYRGGQVPDGKTSLTYRLEYQDFKKTLEDKDISEVHFRILRALQDNLGARQR